MNRLLIRIRVAYVGVRKVQEEVADRSIFNLKLSEIRAGERPGWVARCVFRIEGEHATIIIPVQWNVSMLRARMLQLKLIAVGVYERLFG